MFPRALSRPCRTRRRWKTGEASIATTLPSSPTSRDARTLKTPMLAPTSTKPSPGRSRRRSQAVMCGSQVPNRYRYRWIRSCVSTANRSPEAHCDDSPTGCLAQMGVEPARGERRLPERPGGGPHVTAAERDQGLGHGHAQSCSDAQRSPVMVIAAEGHPSAASRTRGASTSCSRPGITAPRPSTLVKRTGPGGRSRRSRSTARGRRRSSYTLQRHSNRNHHDVPRPHVAAPNPPLTARPSAWFGTGPSLVGDRSRAMPTACGTRYRAGSGRAGPPEKLTENVRRTGWLSGRWAADLSGCPGGRLATAT